MSGFGAFIDPPTPASGGYDSYGFSFLQNPLALVVIAVVLFLAYRYYSDAAKASGSYSSRSRFRSPVRRQ